MKITYRSSPPPAVAYELKTCELCGRNFTRVVGSQDKDCGPCSTKKTTREPIPITSGRKAKTKNNTSASSLEPASKRHVVRIDAAQQLRNVWLKNRLAQPDAVEDLRHAWHLQ